LVIREVIPGLFLSIIDGEGSDRPDGPGLPASRPMGSARRGRPLGRSNPGQSGTAAPTAAQGRLPNAPEYLPSHRRHARSRVIPPSLPCLATRDVRADPGPHASSPRARPRAGQARFSFGLRPSPGKVRDSQQEGGRPWMGRERGGHATRPARHGTHATGSGGSPASWDSTTGPGTGPRPRRPAPGTPQPHEHDCNDHGVSRRVAGPGHARRRRAPPRARGRTPHTDRRWQPSVATHPPRRLTPS
jgi:hypothetical protein